VRFSALPACAWWPPGILAAILANQRPIYAQKPAKMQHHPARKSQGRWALEKVWGRRPACGLTGFPARWACLPWRDAAQTRRRDACATFWSAALRRPKPPIRTRPAIRLPSLRSATLQTPHPHSGRPTASEIGKTPEETRRFYKWSGGDPQMNATNSKSCYKGLTTDQTVCKYNVDTLHGHYIYN
jgi:hypothetical protein